VARVLIVGAGPAGAGLALALARRDQGQVDLVEAATDALGRFRGEGLMPSGLEALERLEAWPLPAAVPHRPLAGWSFQLEGRPLFEAAEPFGAGPACHLIDQPSLLRHLLARAETAGCHLHLGQAVVGLVQERGRVGGVVLADGRRLAADLVVACDGRSSTLRRLAGLALEEEANALRVLWFRLSGPATEAIASELGGSFFSVIGGGDSWGLFASTRGGLQLGWLESGGDAASAPPTSAQAWRERWASVAPPRLAARLRELEEPAIEGPLRLAVKVGLAPRWHAPGLLLLGDAAHPMSPLRAQGTSMALRDVATATALLPPALQQPAGPGREAAIDQALAGLEARRRPEIVQMQALQQREWQRGERLGHNPALRQLLASLAPGLAPLMAAVWRHSQEELRDGLAGALPPTPEPAAMMETTSAAR